MPSLRGTFVCALSCALGLMAQSSFARELSVVASFSILADMVSEIAGEAIEVESIIGPGADAHIYQPSVADAMTVAGADIVFVNGFGFETWASNLISESASDAVVVIATEGISPIEVDGSIDPHAWNAELYMQRLEYIDQDIACRVSRLPESSRTVVTSHDAFGYLAADYGLTFLAPKGIDTDAEPTARALAVLIKQLKNVDAAALFAENITSPALINQIAFETGLEVGGRLYSDALSVPGGPANSYVDMLRHNANNILEILERGSTPGCSEGREIYDQTQLSAME